MKDKLKIKNIIIFGILVIAFVFTFITFFEVKADSAPKKGDLRCPQEELPNNVKCIPHYENGEIKSVEIVYGKLEETGDIQITKKVTKKATIGHYDVQFNVKGKNINPAKKASKAYIALLIDYSTTINNNKNINKIKNAVKKFATTLIPDSQNGISNYYIKLIQFGSSAYVRTSNDAYKNFNNSNKMSLMDYNKMSGHKSYIDKALAKVNFPADDNAKKFIFIFGDGRYWSVNDTDTKKAYKLATEFKNAGVTIYGLRYNGTAVNSDLETDVSVKGVIKCTRKNEKTYKNCDTKMMKALVSESKYSAAGDDWEAQFLEIANSIIDTTGDEEVSYSGDLADTAGSDFYMTDNSGDVKKFTIPSIDEDGWTSETFEIEIDQSVKGDLENGGGWHKTNENFNFSYTDKDGKNHGINVTSSPEVYWEGEGENIYSCSGEATKDTEETESEDYPYYSKKCYEGYKDSKGNYLDGFKVKIKVNNLNDGVKQFNLVNGIGFTTSVNLSTNVKCTYEFKTSEFMNDYNKYQSDIAYYRSLLARNDIPETQDELNKLIEEAKKNGESQDNLPTISKENANKEITSLENKLEGMKSFVETYQLLTEANDIQEYKERFEKQDAILTVHYDNSSDEKEIKLAPIKIADNKMECPESSSPIKVIGYSVVAKKTCTIHLEKEMGIPNACLSMVNGAQEECTNENNQLSGGNKFYVDLSKKSGNVEVLIPNVGYHENYTFRLDKDEEGNPACRFTNNTEKLIFRQIELDDPFLKTKNPDRGVGKNFINNQYKFNFENIIHADTWSDEFEPEYSYNMSKTNISNIKKDTSEDYAGSYLGRNCYFTNENKWWCHFPRNETEDGTDNGEKWFTKVNKK